jgi:hypothetical protein
MGESVMHKSEFEVVLNEVKRHEGGTAREIAKRLRANGHSAFTASRTNQTLYRLLALDLVERDVHGKVPTWRPTAAEQREGTAKSNLARPVKDIGESNLLSYRIASTNVRVLLAEDLSPNDPYYTPDRVGEHLLATVNVRHPFWTTRLGSATDKSLFVMAIAVDAYVHWRSVCMSEPPEPHETHALRDAAFRYCTLITTEAWT